MSNATADTSAGSQSFVLGPLVIADVAYVSTGASEVIEEGGPDVADDCELSEGADQPSIQLTIPFRPGATYGVPKGMTFSFTEGLPEDIKSSIYRELTESGFNTVRFTQLMRDYVDAPNPIRREGRSSVILREPTQREQSRLNLNVSEFGTTSSMDFIDESGEASRPPVSGVYKLSDHHVKFGAPSTSNPGSDITISLSFRKAGDLPLAARTRSQRNV